MDKYEAFGLLGEGSFGRVYKAKRNEDGIFVALKVISKRGRSNKELTGLRRECKIQRNLHHPNIIQMLDSFETDKEIVVITEFAHKELNYILSKEGYLSEERVQKIVWDLVSALYYLHSNRVLHRDLKPQNILLDANNTAKLCDFGFARNMSTGTHVLTSIKGTPLYMAPELIEEQPYDHNADLWSLGCIIYELLVGAPPFCTASILHLIRLIKHEQVQWPTFLSEHCISFLKGLLQKNPGKRMSWQEILNHPFVKGHIIITELAPAMPLTRPMSANTLQVKEHQRNHHISQKISKQTNINTTKVHTEEAKADHDKPTTSKDKTQSSKDKPQASKISKSGETKVTPTTSVETKRQHNELNERISKLSLERNKNTPELTKAEPLDFHEDTQPIESEEWVVFIYKTMEEIMNGQIDCLLQPGSTNVLVIPLRNPRASPKVVGFVANLFCLPFVVTGISSESKEQILQVYLDVKLVPNLIYASKLLIRLKNASQENVDVSAEIKERNVGDLSEEELQCLEHIYLLICHLIYVEEKYVSQFCDSVVILNIYHLINGFLHLGKKKLKIVTDLLAILTHVMHKNPENYEIIDKIIQTPQAGEGLDFVGMLRSNEALLRERMCNFMLQVAKLTPKTIELFWNPQIRDTLEALMYDSVENVRNAAELAVDELKAHEFYTKKSHES
ncbi:serine/threonine-protein kinase fused [Atheta coriaria]|uniref:serine/threonine-protein kinase fused n=1 Tax=Dalotia coriaria TaxID=877792 RepID=UPI0031F45D6E